MSSEHSLFFSQSEEVDYNANEMMKALKTDRILLNKRILLRGSKTVRDYLVTGS